MSHIKAKEDKKTIFLLDRYKIKWFNDKSIIENSPQTAGRCSLQRRKSILSVSFLDDVYALFNSRYAFFIICFTEE